MILVLGGQRSGKTAFVKKLGYTSDQIADAVLDERPVVRHVEQLVRACPENAEALAEALAQKQAVLCRETGGGLVPANQRERIAREATGRLCALLAQKADTVVRISCGIPMAIRGTLRWPTAE